MTITLVIIHLINLLPVLLHLIAKGCLRNVFFPLFCFLFVFIGNFLVAIIFLNWVQLFANFKQDEIHNHFNYQYEMVCKQARAFPLCQGLRYLKLSIKKVMCGMLLVPQKLFRFFKWTQNGNISLCKEKEIVAQYGSKIC